jgi:hypothetical protein
MQGRRLEPVGPAEQGRIIRHGLRIKLFRSNHQIFMISINIHQTIR